MSMLHTEVVVLRINNFVSMSHRTSSSPEGFCQDKAFVEDRTHGDRVYKLRAVFPMFSMVWWTTQYHVHPLMLMSKLLPHEEAGRGREEEEEVICERFTGVAIVSEY